ncbi:MAG TPA: hypothetical protein VFU07_05430 [Candidatus Lumbricidophila sp.]|nr:hypothetical protein [Candidatus Lumbricidophila sp.]
MSLITRKDYLQRSSAAHNHPSPRTPFDEHRAFFAQFVTEATRDHVKSWISTSELEEALLDDPNLNSISLNRWDALSWRLTNGSFTSRATAAGNQSGPFYATIPFDRKAVLLADEAVTRTTLVCIAKEAARQLVERAAQSALAGQPALVSA